MPTLFRIAITFVLMQANASFGGANLPPHLALPVELNPPIEKILRESATSGASAVALTNGQVLFGSYGEIGLSAQTAAVNPDTYYRVGSVSKIFTALGILKLAEEDRLKLQDPVSKYLPWFNISSHPAWSRQITLYHLLTHTSGISREFGCPFSEVQGAWIPMKSVEECVNNQEIFFKPGTSLKYSNLGFALLGAVIETIELGHSTLPSENLVGFERYMIREILKPLGMNTAKYTLDEADFVNMAQGYGVKSGNGSGRVEIKYARHALANTPAYFLAMTGRDLPGALKVLRSIGQRGDLVSTSNKVILKAKSLEMMMDQRAKDPHSNYEYGLGLTYMKDPKSSRFLIGHSGGSPGYRVFFAYDPASDVGAAVMTNVPENPSRAIADVILKKYSSSGEGIIGLQDASPSSESLADLKGIYSGTYIDWAYTFQIFTVGMDFTTDRATARPVLDILYDGKRRRMIPIPNDSASYRIPMEGPYSGQKGEVIRFEVMKDHEGKEVCTGLLMSQGYRFDRL